MPPTPKDQGLIREAKVAEPLDGNAVVISGMAGLYPASRYVKDLENVLYNKINPVSSENLRWKYNHPEAANHVGIVPDLDRFDAQFFRVHYRLGANMDSMARKILEQAYEAIYDAGINPGELWGKKVGVYIGTCFSESEKACFYVANTRTGFGIAGCSKTMFANRISYWLNAKGPSMSIDEACCSSTAALEQAYLAISRGECEAAVVGGAYLCLHPQSSVHYSRIMNISKDGTTRSFDQNPKGCAKSEAVNVLFLQKAKDSKRIYATVKHVKTEYRKLLQGEIGPRFGFYRDPEDTATFLKSFYQNAGVSPRAVEYVEAFGSAVAEADKSELEAIAKVFCETRDSPLLVGSVLSNIGYGEAASGISAVTKVLLGYHNGKLAGNLHCENPRTDLAALKEGRMKILTDHHEFRRTYTAVNSMSVTGVNAHVLLHGYNKHKDSNKYSCDIPRLVTISGRQDSSVAKVIDHLKTHPLDPEELALLNNIHKSTVAGHLGRGYVILDTDEEKNTVSISEKSSYFDDARRPLWFVYSGMGSQWPGMGEALMKIPIFAKAIQRCHQALEPKGINIVDIITSKDPTTFDNILNSFVGIAAVQIGLTDVLKELGVVPDNIIGHSVGELGCAYADGCLTAEEMILSAYSRGLVSLETNFIRGSMAAVGLGSEQVSKMCPLEIEVACHNSSESSTISGPEDVMREFVASLTAKKIFAKEVPCSHIAYHSRYISDAGPGLLKYLKEVIKTPMLRTKRWISTSVPKDKWDEPLAMYSSAEYHTNNLLNPVLFEETSKLIPHNAVLVEIAPHGLLQAILKRSLPETCINIPLTRRKHQNNVVMVLEAIGRLYMEGYNPDLQCLYPKVEFPVSTGTPFLSHLVDWAHDEKWSLPLYSTASRTVAASCRHVISIHDDDYSYLKGRVIRNKILLPPSFILVAIWDTLAMVLGVPRKSFNVKFEDFNLYSQPILNDQRQVRLNISLLRGNGRFEVIDDISKVATGAVKVVSEELDNLDEVPNKYKGLEAKDIYQLFAEREHNYSEEFKSIYSVDDELTEGKIIWNNNWVTFIDGILQVNTLKQNHNSVSRLQRIRSMTIDVTKHQVYHEVENGVTTVPAYITDVYELTTRCGGIIVEGIKFNDSPKKMKNDVLLRAFVPKSDTNLQCRQEIEEQRDEPGLMLQIEEPGNLDKLKWVEAPQINSIGTKVTVHYAGINTIDVKVATGVLPKYGNSMESYTYGMEFSGITTGGERVMGLIKDGSTRNKIEVDPLLMWPVPSHWSLEDAATVPLAYSYVFYCLGLKYNQAVRVVHKEKPTVLVHGGAGALGQAAINVTLASGYEVFVTVSDLRKKRFLLKLFPQLKEENIGNSRDGSFADMVLCATGGVGVDIVFSCVTSDLKDLSLKCSGSFGITYDATQITMGRYNFGMNCLTKERSYVAIDMKSIFSKPEVKQNIRHLVANGISCGWVRPLSRMTFDAGEASRAFNLLAGGHHRGRVLLNLTDLPSPSVQRPSFSPEHTYLVLGDSDQLMSKMVDRLINCGAKKLHVHLTDTPSLLRYKSNRWKSHGVDIVLAKDELKDDATVEKIVKQARERGFLAGVVIMNSKLTYNYVKSLDMATRKLSPYSKYFLALDCKSVVDKNVKQICLRRFKDGLPGTYLSVSELKKNNNSVLDDDVLDSIERALCSPHSVIIPEIVLQPRKHLLNEILTLAGTNMKHDVKTYSSLKDLGFDAEKSEIIATYLNNLYDVYFDPHDVPLLTVERILEIENLHKEKNYTETEGLASFFTYVDPDELMATLEMVSVPTLSNSCDLREDEFSVEEVYLWIVPGVEGHHHRYKTLCERLKLPALVLQPGLDHLEDDPAQIAQRYHKVLMKKIDLSKHFYLAGFETGVSVVLHLAAILENQGQTGTIYCIGDGPRETAKHVDEQMQKYGSEEQLQLSVIRHMFALMVDKEECNMEELERAFKNCSTWDDRVEVCVRELLGRVSHSAQYARALINAAYKRIVAARSYPSLLQTPLRSQIILLRARTTNAGSSATLQQFSTQPIVVYDLPTPLSHITEDLRCSAIVNRHLSQDIHDAFNQRNLCESYLLNANTFMTEIK